MVDQVAVRKLRASDVRTVARILGPQVKNLPTGKDVEASNIGRDLFASILSDNMDDLWAWLADLAGMTSDQLDEQPMHVPLDIIERVMEDEDIGPFGERLRQLLTKDRSGSGTA